MKVYPVNAVQAANLASIHVAPYDSILHLFNKYIEFQVDFVSNDIEITGKWPNGIPFDTFIIGNTNAKTGSLTCYNGTEIVFDIEFVMDEYIKILNNLNQFGTEITESITEFKLNLIGDENIYVGYLFAGEVWKLPRFVINPKHSIQIRNESGRTFSGQVTGIPQHTLRSFSCEFVRVTNDDAKKMEDYVNGVQSVIPHVIDPYYEARKQFPPMFCTIEDSSERSKRNENGFFWNLNMIWQEAR